MEQKQYCNKFNKHLKKKVHMKKNLKKKKKMGLQTSIASSYQVGKFSAHFVEEDIYQKIFTS